MNTKGQRLASLVAAAIFVTSIGCNAMAPTQESASQKTTGDEKSFLDRMPWSGMYGDDEPEPYPNPAKVATTWTPDTLVQTGRTPTRGFGGRVFFYDEKSRAVPVEGTLIVHGFDEAAESQADRVKRFEFTPEQFTRHFSQTDLGASYSVWIPWDAIGGEQRRISLVTSFRTAEGKMVQGVPATVLLPGPSTETTIDVKVSKLSPQYKNYLDATRSGGSNPTGLTTTTIARRTPRSRSVVNRARTKLANQHPAATDLTVTDQQTPFAELDAVQKPAKPTMLPTVRPASAELPLMDRTR
jgi:hypothetical protein